MTDLLPQQRRELFRPGREAFVLVREPQHLPSGQLVVQCELIFGSPGTRLP